MKKVKNNLFINFKVLFIFLIGIMGSSFLVSEVFDKIYYFVNDRVITKLDFEEQRLAIQKSGEVVNTGRFNFENSIMSNMILQVIIEDDLRKKRLAVDDLTINNEIKKIMNQKGISSLYLFREALKKSGIDYDFYYNNLKKQLNQRVFYSKSIVIGNPSNEEIEFYYKSNKKKFKIKSPVFNLYSIKINILNTVGFSQRRKYQKTLQSIRNEIITDKISFEDALTKYNDLINNTLARRLGWMDLEELSLSEDNKSTLTSINKGEVSPIFSNSEGLTLYLIKDKVSQGELPFSLAKKRAERELVNQKRTEAINGTFRKLFKSAYLKNNSEIFKPLARLIDRNPNEL